jgi:hypothetical protein
MPEKQFEKGKHVSKTSLDGDLLVNLAAYPKLMGLESDQQCQGRLRKKIK